MLVTQENWIPQRMVCLSLSLILSLIMQHRAVNFTIVQVHWTLNTSMEADHFNSIIPGLVWLCSTSIIVLILINESALPSIKSVGFPRSRLTECQEALAVSQHLCHPVKDQSWVLHYFRSTKPPTVIFLKAMTYHNTWFGTEMYFYLWGLLLLGN